MLVRYTTPVTTVGVIKNVKVSVVRHAASVFNLKNVFFLRLIPFIKWNVIFVTFYTSRCCCHSLLML